MDSITVAQDVLNLIQADHGEIGEDLTTTERLVKAQVDCPCGQQQRFVEYRPRTLESVLGPVTLHRAYYHCPSCRQGGAPYDAQAGLGAMAVSPGLAKMACELSVDLPFAKSAAKLMRLTGRERWSDVNS